MLPLTTILRKSKTLAGKYKMRNREKSIIQENLATLYLRLNGYFTTGFIIHSEGNSIDAELDIVAIRFPKHKQDYTGHNSSEYLEVPPYIDIIIAEVKSKGVKLQFNDSLRQQSTLEPWKKMLEWIGLLTDDQIISVAEELNILVQPMVNSQRKYLRSTEIIKTEFGDLTVRPVIFCPERVRKNNCDKFIDWTEVNDFVWKCLCPLETRDSCGTRYDFTSWGIGLFDIVKVFKDRQKTQDKFKTMTELYSDITNNKKGIVNY